MMVHFDKTDKGGWCCCDLRLGSLWIHWHWGANEVHKKPKFRLRCIAIGKWDLPLKYYNC
jgi:hypothetical protein